MTESAKHSVSVAGVVVNDRGQVLVICRRDNGHWETPGGVLELGESFEDGVRREVAEETGFDVSVDRLTGIYKNMTLGVVALVFLCTLTDARQRDIDGEATSVKWIEPAEVATRMVPAFAVRVMDALRGGPPATRVHDGVGLIN